jgi:hypothetical protein
MEYFILGIAAGLCFSLLVVNLPEEGATWHDLKSEMLCVIRTGLLRCSRSPLLSLILSAREQTSVTTATTYLADRLRRMIAIARQQLTMTRSVGPLGVEA